MSTSNSPPHPRPEASSQFRDDVTNFDLVSSTSLGPASQGLGSGKRKREDDDDTASEAVDTSKIRKKLKVEGAPGVEVEFPLLRPETVPDTLATAENPADNAESRTSLGLEDESAHTESRTAASTLPTTPTAQSDPPSSPISLRSMSAPPTSPVVTVGSYPLPNPTSLPSEPEPLHTYACPICFASPTNATLTPCGHIMCGECLFTAVGSAAARMGIASLAVRCPVCRAPIPHWDGRGGGVIGLQPRVVITI